MRAIGSPQNTKRDAERHRQTLPSERHRSERTDQAADAECGRHVADRFSACVEHLERGDHDQDVQAAADESLREDQRDDEPNARQPRNRAEPRRKRIPDTLTGRHQADPVLDPDAEEQHGGNEEGCCTDGEHDPGVRDRYENAGEERPDERAEALDRRRGAVGCDELLGSARERRQQCLERRPDERDREPEQGGECEHERFDVREERDRRRSERDGCNQCQSEQETLPREAVAQGGGKRRNDRGGQETNEAGEADRSRSADVIGVHAECDEVRPLCCDRRAPRQFRAPDVRVPKS